jgi:xanthine dehydrogenase accessory factor
MSFDLMQINAAIAAHGEATRVVIADIKGSSPREIGASMLLWPEVKAAVLAAVHWNTKPRLRHNLACGAIRLGQSWGNVVAGM